MTERTDRTSFEPGEIVNITIKGARVANAYGTGRGRAEAPEDTGTVLVFRMDGARYDKAHTVNMGDPGVTVERVTTPPEEMRAIAAVLRGRAAAALKDLRDSKYYGHDPANFANGINNACGGEAAELAAMFNPVVAESLAEWLETEANMWETRGNTHEGHTFHALKTARALNGGEPGA